MSKQINKKAAEIKELGANIKQALRGEGDIDTQEVLKKTALVGISALIVFWLISKLFRKTGNESVPEKKKKKKKDDSMVFDMIKQQIGIIILAIFRKHILKLLKEYKLIDEKEDI
jgi:di/tricarboxylate transporter